MNSTSIREGLIQTVRGPIRPDQLGMTLPHEHLYDQLWEIPGRNDYAGQIDDDEVVYEEVLAYRNGSAPNQPGWSLNLSRNYWRGGDR